MARLTLLSGGAALLVVLVSGQPAAHAWNQTKTCLYPQDRDPLAPSQVPDCKPGQTPYPVSWPVTRVPYWLNERGTSQLDRDADGTIGERAIALMRSGVEAWNDQSCSAFVFEYQGLTPKASQDSTDATNLVTWVDEGWPTSRATLALTTTTTTQQGALVDADVEINSEFSLFADLDASQVSHPEQMIYDVRAAIAHEAGHMLGLDHSARADATMFFSEPPNEIKKRDLHIDDLEGLCTLYSEPIEPDEDLDDEGCCATIARAAPAPPRTLWCLFAALAALAVGRRRRGAP